MMHWTVVQTEEETPSSQLLSPTCMYMILGVVALFWTATQWNTNTNKNITPDPATCCAIVEWEPISIAQCICPLVGCYYCVYLTDRHNCFLNTIEEKKRQLKKNTIEVGSSSSPIAAFLISKDLLRSRSYGLKYISHPPMEKAKSQRWVQSLGYP